MFCTKFLKPDVSTSKTVYIANEFCGNSKGSFSKVTYVSANIDGGFDEVGFSQLFFHFGAQFVWFRNAPILDLLNKSKPNCK